MTMNEMKFADAYARGSLDVWPGCGSTGKCRPCGRVGCDPNGNVVCIQWLKWGCPSQATRAKHVQHDLGQWGCRTCGQRRGWRSLRSKIWYETKHKAALAGEAISSLVRATWGKGDPRHV